jgi:hypothetical protein
MESASKIFGRLAAEDRTISSELVVLSAWKGAVGKRIAAHARAAKMVRTRLVVEVEDEIWQKQLFVMSRQILGVLETKIGRGIVDELHFKIVPRRIEPQRAVSLFSPDEADRIADPMMRHIYKAARNKEIA